MCGIVAAVAKRNITSILVEGLKRLEYRGYDSCGVALHMDGELQRSRSTARVAELEKQIDERQQLNVFEEMLSTTTFSTNPIALIIWISLAFSSSAIFILFSIALYYYYRRHNNPDMDHEQQPPFNPDVPPQLQLPPELLQRLMQVYMQQNVPVRMNNPLAIQ